MWACGGAGSCCRWTDTDGSKERCEWNQNLGLTHTCTHMHTHMFTWREEAEPGCRAGRGPLPGLARCSARPRVLGARVPGPVSHPRRGCLPWLQWLIALLLDGTQTVDLFSGLKYGICLTWAFVSFFFFYIIQSSNTEGLCHLCKPASHTSLRTSVSLCCQSTSRRRFNTTLVVRLQCTHRSRLWGSAWATVKRIGVRPRVTARWRQPWLPCWYRDIIGVLSASRDP